MSNCEINYMDVITYTCSVRCIIIVSKYTKALKFTDCDLCNVWNQVVRNSLWIFSDQSALMSSDWIEVTKKYDIPLRICCIFSSADGEGSQRTGKCMYIKARWNQGLQMRH